MKVRFWVKFRLSSNVRDDHQGGELLGAEFDLQREGEQTISRGIVSFTKDSEIGDVLDGDTFKRVRESLDEEYGLVRLHAEKLLNDFLNLLTAERLRDTEVIEIADTERVGITRKVEGSQYEMEYFCERDSLEINDSFSISEVNSETGEVIKKYQWPDTSRIISTTQALPDYYSWFRQARLAAHPFDAFRNYYLIIEHLGTKGSNATHLTALQNKVSALGISEVNGVAVDEQLLKDLYRQGRNALNHSKDNYKLPTNPKDVAEIEKLLPIARALAQRLIQAEPKVLSRSGD